METPLLAECDADRSLLSSDPVLVVAEESSFSRLIAQVHPLQLLADRFNQQQYPAGIDGHVGRSNRPRRYYTRGIVTTASAGALCLLHLALVWASYMSGTWAEVRVDAAVGWQRQYVPDIDTWTSWTIRSSNLASILQDLDSSQQHFLLPVLWCTSLILPCIFMVLSPSWIIEDFTQPILVGQRMRRFQFRNLFELSLRLAMMVFYVLIIVAFSISTVGIQWTDTAIQIRSRACESFCAYVLAISCALAATMVLRSPPNQSATVVSGTEIKPVRAGPTTPQPQHRPGRDRDDSDDVVAMTVLEESPSTANNGSSHLTPSNGHPDTQATPLDRQPTGGAIRQRISPSFGQVVFVFEIGLLATILWVPALYLPLFRLSYHGSLAALLKEQSIKVFFGQMPGLLWHQGREAGTTRWVLLMTGTVLLATVLLLPAAATCLAILAWFSDGTWKSRSRSWLYCIHPALGGLVFAVALLSTVPAMHRLSTLLFQDGLCPVVSQWVAPALGRDSCLSISGHILPGAVFAITESIALDLFVFLTLRWS